MEFLEENINFLESSTIYESISSPSCCPLPQEINIIPKEDYFVNKELLSIFNEKISKDINLIDEKKLFFTDKENEDRNNDKLCGHKRVKYEEKNEKQHNKFLHLLIFHLDISGNE